MALRQNSTENENPIPINPKKVAVALLEFHQISIKPDRVCILEAFFQSPVTLTISQIRQKAQLVCNKTTIYRTIDRFLQKGLIHRITDCEGVIRYGLTAQVQVSGQFRESLADGLPQGYATHSLPSGEQHSGEQHIHFKCDRCQSVICLFELRINMPSLPEGYTVHKINMLVVGLCAKCTHSTG